MVHETLIEARKPTLFRLRLRVFCNVLQLGCLQKTYSLFPIIWLQEKDAKCKEVIRARLSEGHFGSADLPIYSNVETFSMKSVAGQGVSGLAGGFPCQAGLIWCVRETESHMFCIVLSFIFISLPASGQGTSRAGLKGGMSDHRSSSWNISLDFGTRGKRLEKSCDRLRLKVGYSPCSMFQPIDWWLTFKLS